MLIAAPLDFFFLFFFSWAPQDPQPQNPGPGPRTPGPHFFFPRHPRTHNPRIQDQAPGPQDPSFFFLGTPGPTTPESRTRPQDPRTPGPRAAAAAACWAAAVSPRIFESRFAPILRGWGWWAGKAPPAELMGFYRAGSIPGRCRLLFRDDVRGDRTTTNGPTRA